MSDLHNILTDRLAARQVALRRAADWINRHHPKQRDKILALAENALSGKILISGSGGQPVFAGDPPAWKEIRTGDTHYGSDLNRMLHWDGLSKAFWLTGDTRYAKRMLNETLDWIEQCPRPTLPSTDAERISRFYAVTPEGVPWHSLNSGIRLFSGWRMMLETLAGSPLLNTENLTAIAVAMREQSEAIRAVSPNLFPDAYHNHYLMEMLGVLSFARCFPDLPQAVEWGTEAAAEIERCALAQLTEDGAQVEGCPGYHSGCMGWFCLARQFAAECGFPLSAAADARIRHGFLYAVQATRPMGTDVPWGDSHAGHGFVTSAVWALYAFDDLEPLAQAAMFTPLRDLKQSCAGSLWNAPDGDRLDKLCHVINAADEPVVPLSRPWPRVHIQRQVKQVNLRTAWQTNALGVFFAAYSPVHYGNHGHIDPCGFDFSAYGVPLVVDGGSCTYDETERRRRTKSATGHNMLTVNFREPFDYCSSFAYGPQQEGEIDWIQETDRLLAVQGRHHNYAPALHRRALVLVDNRFLVVLDHLSDLFWLSSVQMYYQLASETVHPRPDHEPGVIAGCRNAGDSGQVVDVAVVPDTSLRLKIPPYRLHPEPDAPRITTVRFDDSGSSHLTERCYATLIVPAHRGEKMPEIHAPKIDGKAEKRICAFKVGEKDYCLEWMCGGIALSP